MCTWSLVTGSSPVTGFEKHAQGFVADMKAAGVTVATAATALAGGSSMLLPDECLEAYDVFVSYCWPDDKVLSESLCQHLERSHVGGESIIVFRDSDRMRMRFDYCEVYAKALCRSAVLVLVVSDNALKRMRVEAPPPDAITINQEDFHDIYERDSAYRKKMSEQVDYTLLEWVMGLCLHQCDEPSTKHSGCRRIVTLILDGCNPASRVSNILQRVGGEDVGGEGVGAWQSDIMFELGQAMGQHLQTLDSTFCAVADTYPGIHTSTISISSVAIARSLSSSAASPSSAITFPSIVSAVSRCSPHRHIERGKEATAQVLSD